MDRQTDGRNCYYKYRPLHLDAESCFKKFIHFRDRWCVRTLRPLFVYATARGFGEKLTRNRLRNGSAAEMDTDPTHRSSDPTQPNPTKNCLFMTRSHLTHTCTEIHQMPKKTVALSTQWPAQIKRRIEKRYFKEQKNT